LDPDPYLDSLEMLDLDPDSQLCHNFTKLPFMFFKMIFSCSGDGQVSGPTVSNTGRIQVRKINNYAYSFPALLC
jgi:hypothetical protein